MNPQKPNYAPNVVNQTVDFGGYRWKGNPGSDWTMVGQTGQQGTDNAGFSGGSQPTDQANQNFQNLLTANTKAVTDFLPKFQSDVQSAQTNEYNKFNVPQNQSIVSNLTSRISSLENNSGNAAGGDVGNIGNAGALTMDEVDKAISSRYLPQLNSAQQNLDTSATLATNAVNQDIAPDQAFSQLLATNIQSSMQGLSSEQQSTLQYLLGKLQAGTQLTQTEITAGEALAQQVLQNANNITLQNMKNAYTPIPAGDTIMNPNSGAIINPGMLAASGAYTP